MRAAPRWVRGRRPFGLCSFFQAVLFLKSVLFFLLERKNAVRSSKNTGNKTKKHHAARAPPRSGSDERRWRRAVGRRRRRRGGSARARAAPSARRRVTCPRRESLLSFSTRLKGSHSPPNLVTLESVSGNFGPRARVRALEIVMTPETRLHPLFSKFKNSEIHQIAPLFGDIQYRSRTSR